MKRIILLLVMGLLSSASLLWYESCLAQPSQQEKFPNRPVTIIVSFGAGGSTDVAVRLFAKVAERKLGVPILVSNKPGGGATVGVTEVARSKPDGYTIGTLNIGTMTVTPWLQKVAYDPHKDFDYICGFGRFVYGLYAKAGSPFRSIKDVVESARKNPGKVSYGSMSPSIAIGLKCVELQENVKMTYIPLQSGQETASMLVGGHIDLGIATAIYQFVESKEVVLLAWFTEERDPVQPDVPAMKELGYDIDLTGWMAFGAPAGVPKERLAILYDAFKVASEDAGVKATLEKLNLSAPYITGEEIKTIYRKKGTQWKPLIEAILAEKTAK